MSTHWMAVIEFAKLFTLTEHTTTGSSNCKESACSAGDVGSIPGSGRSPGGEHGNPLQYSCLENPTHRGAQEV